MKARTLNSPLLRNKATGRALAAMLICLGIGLCPQQMAWAMSSADTATYKQAFRAADKGKFEEAIALAKRTDEALPAQVLLWMALTQPGADASWDALNGFMKRHPDWPNQAALRRNAEAKMPADMPYAQVREWFEKNPPLTLTGFGRYVDALMETGSSDKAIQAVRDRYVNGSFGATEERDYRGRYISLLQPGDHVARLNRLLWEEKVEEARRVMPLVGPGLQAVAEARIALAAMSPGVDGALRRVPAELNNDPGLQYDRTRWRRRKDMDAAALELLSEKIPDEAQHAADWWTERHILARRLMEEGQFQRAYDLVAAHATKEGLAFAQAEFLAGWLALRKLNKPDVAEKHFEALFRGTTSPVSKSRGAYWVGRALEEIGDKERSVSWYETATEYGGTFYGLLAADHLNKPAGSTLPPEPTPTAEERKAFERREMVRIVELLSRIEGSDSDRVTLFLRKLALDAKSGETYRMVGELALASKRPDMAVTTARAAWQDGYLLRTEGFPTLSTKVPARPEIALIHGIIRQESNFRDDVTSAAGARGLMQVMPTTASGVVHQQTKAPEKPPVKAAISSKPQSKATDKKNTKKPNAKPVAKAPPKKKYDADRLISDPRHNVEVGSSYLADMVDKFDGSYVLAIASYNAGPGRVSGWLRDYGDPRSSGVDIIDWIETMPIYETRNYVQRVLENLHIYRARMGQPPMRMTHDLARGAATNG